MSDSGDTSPDGRLNSSSLTDDLDKSMGSLTTQESPIRCKSNFYINKSNILLSDKLDKSNF